MENVSPKAVCRKRRHKSRGARSGREDRHRKHPLLLKECTEMRKTADCYITHNRLTMRMGLFNKGRESNIILRTDGGDKGGGGGGRGGESGSRWQKVALYQGQAAETFLHQPRMKEKHLNGVVSCGAVDEENRTDAADDDVSSTYILPSSPGIEKSSLFLTEHIDPKCVIPSGYLQRVRKGLLEQHITSLQKVEEEKENLDEPECLCRQGSHQRQQQQPKAPLHATENNTEDAAALWWSSSAGAKCFDIPPPAMPPPPYLLLNPSDITGQRTSSGRLGNNVKEFWSAHDGLMKRSDINFVSQPLLNITDAESLLALSDFVHGDKHSYSSSCHAPSSVPISSSLGLPMLPSFVNDNPASGPSSSEWAVDLDYGRLKYIHQSTRRNPNVTYFNQTDSGPDVVLDIAETNQMSTDYLLRLSSDHSNDLATAADGTDEHQTMVGGGGGLLSLMNSQSSMDETLGSWETQALPKLLLATVHSPSPEQRYYRRKIF